VNARRREVWLWTAQRATAAILAVCVVAHLVTIVYAVHGGLSAAEILGRTRGNVAWGIFYSVFVFAAAIHGSIGLRTIAAEWLGFRGRAAEAAAFAIALALAVTGMRAVLAVVSG
jgi:fumarate reductase subunit C